MDEIDVNTVKRIVREGGDDFWRENGWITNEMLDILNKEGYDLNLIRPEDK